VIQPPAVEKEEELKDRKERAQLRLQIWLGLAKYQSEWRGDNPSGEVAVHAEMVSMYRSLQVQQCLYVCINYHDALITIQ